MNDSKIKQRLERLKQSFSALPKKKRLLLVGGSAAVVLLALVLTIALNSTSSAYRVLFPGMATSETADMYPVLKDLGANPKLSDTGEVMVPSDEHDIWILQMTAKGYPRTTPPYDIYGENSGITTTDAEQQQWKIYQLQDRIQVTLTRMSGVESAVVTMNVPKTSDFVWPSADSNQTATAGVTLSLRQGVSLDTEQISTIKNLVASNIAGMAPEDVTVVDAATMKELTVASDSSEITVAQNLEFERIVQKQLEDNIVRLLETRYGSGGVVAAAKVTLNYDKMLTEQMDLSKPLDAEGNPEKDGFLTSTEGEYVIGGQETIGGIVGETDNTDIPVYPYVTPGDDEDTTYYRWNTQFDYSYLKRQIEKGQAAIERATVSVMVDEENLTQARREELVSLISRSVDIEPDLVFVSAYSPDASDPQLPQDPGETVPQTPLEELLTLVPLELLLLAGGLVLLIIGLVIFLLVRRKRKRKRLIAQLEKQEEEARQQVEEEINLYKKQLTSAAKSTNNAKDDAILTEVRDFAKINPEITASLLRSWLKEGED